MTDDAYPENWAEIADQVKSKVAYCCEECNAPHDPAAGRTITVHHLNGDKSNSEAENLRALCQSCHLRYQSALRQGRNLLEERKAMTPLPFEEEHHA